MESSREPSDAKLSPRERDCLMLVPTLGTSKAIALHLGLSANTVDGYLSAAMRKLGVVDRFAAARAYAAQQLCASPTNILVPRIPGIASEPAQQETDSAVREVPIPFEVDEIQPPIGSGLLGPLTRREGGRNELSARQRLLLSLQVTAVTVVILFLLAASLLAFGAAHRELNWP